jgi:hypothetical protein
VYLDARFLPAVLGYKSGKKFHVVLPAPVGFAMAAHSLNAGVKQQYLKCGSCGRVSRLIGADQLLQVIEHFVPPVI